MADISKIKTPNNIEYNVKDAALTTEITNARGNYVNLDARLDNYDEVIGDIDTALNNLLVTLVPKTITENGVYDPTDDNADGYSSVSVNVPNTYTQADEGKVVSNGALISQTTKNITENGTIDTTTNNTVQVNVPTGASESDVQNLVIASKPYYQTTTGTSSTKTITSEIYAKNYTTYYYPLYMLKGLMFTITRGHKTTNSFTGYAQADCKVILKSNDTIIATYDLGRFSKYRDRQSINETITSTFDISNFQEYFASYPNAILYIENTGITPTNPPLSTTVTLASTTKST